MFFCKKCGKKNGWEESYRKSDGKCEVCDKVAECSDVPSWYLSLLKTPKENA